MPYKSEKQRRYLHVNEPELAAKWDQKYGPKTGAYAKAIRDGNQTKGDGRKVGTGAAVG